jgi:hypothetical protein
MFSGQQSGVVPTIYCTSVPAARRSTYVPYMVPLVYVLHTMILLQIRTIVASIVDPDQPDLKLFAIKINTGIFY